AHNGPELLHLQRHRREDVVEVVGNASRKLTDGFHPLALLQAAFARHQRFGGPCLRFGRGAPFHEGRIEHQPRQREKPDEELQTQQAGVGRDPTEDCGLLAKDQHGAQD
ncbi:MAG: hypothetical protein ACK559_07900, partial [bacterium]